MKPGDLVSRTETPPRVDIYKNSSPLQSSRNGDIGDPLVYSSNSTTDVFFVLFVHSDDDVTAWARDRHWIMVVCPNGSVGWGHKSDFTVVS